jgi:hydroxymethylbilane synthase
VTEVLRIATRGSTLAIWQAEHVAALLRKAPAHVEVEFVVVDTTGDIKPDVPLHALGGQGVFVKEVQQAVLDGRADCAVHSAKDLPSSIEMPGLVLAAIPERGDPRDALVGRCLEDLAEGAVVATGSVRRKAQLELIRPDLTFTDLRGNIQTRLTKVPEGGAIVIAFVALERLALGDRCAEVFDVDVMVPQIGQGALAIECRADDGAAIEILAALDHAATREQVETERAYLATFGAGCDLPIGAFVDAVPGDLRTFALFEGPGGRHVHRAVTRLVAGGSVGRAHELAARTLAEARREVGFPHP